MTIDVAANRAIGRVKTLFGSEMIWSEESAATEAPSPNSDEPTYQIISEDEPLWRVVKVVDGDTVDIRRDGQTVRVRLLCIDAPENRQPYGAASRQYLANMVAGKDVRVEGDETDSDGRLLARIYSDGTDTSANWRMVRDGYAWDYEFFTCGRDYRRAEKTARNESLGLWAEPNAVPPWEWRRR